MLVLQSTTTRHSNLREALSENVSTQLGLVGSSNNPVPSIEIHAGIWDEELMSESGFWHVLAIGIILIGEGINSFYVSRYPPTASRAPGCFASLTDCKDTSSWRQSGSSSMELSTSESTQKLQYHLYNATTFRRSTRVHLKTLP